jgi:hypothetical protein
MAVYDKVNLQEVEDFIKKQSPETRIYIGSDSARRQINRVWHADYAVAIVVHIDGCKGGKIFGEVVCERDYDRSKNRPAMRLMNEVYKVAEMYNRLVEIADGREVELHIDINKKKTAGSSCVVDQAIGYIRGMCQTEPKIKPDAFAASFAADRLKRILMEAA